MRNPVKEDPMELLGVSKEDDLCDITDPIVLASILVARAHAMAREGDDMRELLSVLQRTETALNVARGQRTLPFIWRTIPPEGWIVQRQCQAQKQPQQQYANPSSGKRFLVDCSHGSPANNLTGAQCCLSAPSCHISHTACLNTCDTLECIPEHSEWETSTTTATCDDHQQQERHPLLPVMAKPKWPAWCVNNTVVGI